MLGGATGPVAAFGMPDPVPGAAKGLFALVAADGVGGVGCRARCALRLCAFAETTIAGKRVGPAVELVALGDCTSARAVG
jgi:hypothetical protein